MPDPNPNPNYITQVPVTSRTIISGDKTYFCEAVIGTLSSVALWRIFEVDETDANNVTLLWADGNKNYDNIADNAASLSYS